MENYLLGSSCDYNECTLRREGNTHCPLNFRDCPVYQESELIEDLIEQTNSFNRRQIEEPKDI